MGGKTSKSTQAITIPPEVLARYNAINARADQVTNRPFQYYSGQFVAPLTSTQQAGISGTNAAANMAQPYYGAATGQLMGAQQAASPYYQAATDQLAQGVNAGAQFAGQSAATLNNAQNVGNQFAGQSSNTINAAQSEGAGIQQNALNNLGAAYSSAQPYNEAAGGLYQQGLAQGSDITGRSLAGTQQALTGAQPYQGMATDYMTSGAQAVNPYDLGADQINKYMSPYLNTVLQGTAGILNQQNQQQQAGQMGNAIRSGAFGGDRSGIAAANLNQQQNLANAQIFSGILNQGFGQALGTAQQQQQLGLGAAQANRAAQQQAAQQALAIGQQGFGQGLAAAQQQGNLGQQLFNMNSTTGQNAAALGQQVYGQGTNTAQQQSAVGNTLFNQGATTAAQQAALGQQQFGQGATAAAQQAALGQQQFGQGTAASQQAASLGQGIYGMGSATSQQLANLGQGAQGAALQGAGAQLAAGQTEQATQQALDTAKYNEFLQAQSLPYQQLKLASDIAQGTGALSGSTTTTMQPGGFFSDERLKENIKAVGKTFDGQTIHSYNYKGDPRTQIGLIAQEVQKHHPEAVGLAGGYKTVDYDKATEDAADRGHMAHGGLASMGGGVMPYHSGQGFADGGVAGLDPAVMQQILAAQQAMYAPFNQGAGSVYAGGPGAAGGLVPQVDSVSRQLMTAGDLPGVTTGIEKAGQIAQLGKTVGELGGEFGAWEWGDKKDDKKTLVPTKAADAAPAATGVAPPKPVDTSAPKPEEFSRPKTEESNRPKRAVGGGMPYSAQMNGPGLDIPDGSSGKAPELLTASPLQKNQSGFSKLLGTASKAASVYNYFKPKEVATGGSIPYESNMSGKGLDIPDGDTDKPHELMTAPELEKKKSGLSKLLDKGAKAAAIYATVASDKRLKENIKPIGKLFDGQIVHSYNYKGDPRTQIGLIAQEVEGHKPHAVGLAGNYKTVDYKKATSAAAHRGHFAVGGMPEMEEDDVPSYEPTGLYHGDNKFVRNLFKSTASGNKNIDLMSGEEVPSTPVEEPAESGFAKPVSSTGLAAAAEEGLPELLQAKKRMPFEKPTGLAPAKAILPKNLSAISQLILRAEGDGAAKTSSALGKYGIIKGTYVNYFKKAFPEQARELGDQGIIALRTTPEGRKLNEQFGPMIIADNANTLSKAGFEPDAGNVYLAHFLGPKGAVRALSAGYDTPVEKAVDSDSIDANPDVFKKVRTVGDLVNWSNNLMARRAQEMGRGKYQTGGSPKEDLLSDEVRGLAAADALQSDLPVEAIETAPEFKKPTGLAPERDAIQADLVADPSAVTPAVKPTGLAAPAPAAPAETSAPAAPAPAAAPAEDNNFFRGIAKGKATSIIPLLSGIAAMGTAPTRSLGVALSAGLGAGAQAAQGQRAFGIKQGELKVAQQLADARTMEITKGILEGRYQFLENGQVWDRYSDTFLPADQATIAKAKAFAKGPQEALTATSPAGMPRAEYEKKFPTAGTVVPNLPTEHSYNPNPNNPRETILAAGELNDGVMDARASRDAAEYRMKQLYTALSAPGVGTERYAQLSNLYDRAKGEYERANALWQNTLKDVTQSAIAALDAGNQALIQTNANALAPLIEDARTATLTRDKINEMLPIIQSGGPLSTTLSKIGSTMKQVGFDPNFVDNIMTAPEDVQTQNLLATQLMSAGMDARAVEALRAGSGANFSQEAVKALLVSQLRKADSQIAAFQSANNRFQKNPLGADVPGQGLNAQRAELGARYFTKMPPAGSLPKGTVYYVAGQRYVAQ